MCQTVGEGVVVVEAMEGKPGRAKQGICRRRVGGDESGRRIKGRGSTTCVIFEPGEGIGRNRSAVIFRSIIFVGGVTLRPRGFEWVYDR
jgi:hypothetical protein